MSERTVMEKADDIMASMGLADAVPLSEATTESIDSVGKSYSEELPELSDEQRNELLEHSLGEGNLGQELKKRGLTGAGTEFDTSGGGKAKKKKAKKGTPKVRRQTRARVKAGKPLKKGTAKVVANDPEADLQAAIEAAERMENSNQDPYLKANESKVEVSRKISKLRKEGKPQDQAVAIALDMEERGKLSEVLSEMSTVGMMGMNSGGASFKPARKKKKGSKGSSQYISFQLAKLK